MIEDKINNILKSWNPLDIPEFIAEDEYKSYIKNIMSLRAILKLDRGKL